MIQLWLIILKSIILQTNKFKICNYHWIKQGKRRIYDECSVYNVFLQGQGFIDQTSMNGAGKSIASVALDFVTLLSSMGCRITSLQRNEKENTRKCLLFKQQ